MTFSDLNECTFTYLQGAMHRVDLKRLSWISNLTNVKDYPVSISNSIKYGGIVMILVKVLHINLQQENVCVCNICNINKDLFETLFSLRNMFVYRNCIPSIM